ncbi:acyl-CoA desaturase [Nostocales cyanobacterium HT-58-2]|nr:acyl-CoA desaturase [Nostocales cyanobacterium HT-58-2]
MTSASSTKLRLAWPNILFLAAVHLAALFVFLPSNFSWAAVSLALFLHWVTGCLGITLGWHRLVAHRSFQVPKYLEYLLVFFGSLSCQGSPIDWIGLHRNHHMHSDQELDQHQASKGFWWSHIGWMLHEVPAPIIMERYVKDILDDQFYHFLEKYFLGIQFILAVLLYLLGGWSFVVWGIFVRLVLSYHCTWLVNSAAHMFGYRTYDCGDRSTNCWWVALLTYGEGWHNNHHAFQYSARHGLQWWEIDLTWIIIWFLQQTKLARKVQVAKETKWKMPSMPTLL